MRTKPWILINVIGIGLYACLASGNWSQENVPILFRTDDDLMRWLEFCLPVLALFALFNGVWLVLILFRIRRIKSWKASISWILMSALWFAAFKYDRYRFTREAAPLSKEQEDVMDRAEAASDRDAAEIVKECEAKGIQPYRVDAAGGRYYYLPRGSNSTVSGSNEQTVLECDTKTGQVSATKLPMSGETGFVPPTQKQDQK